MKVRWVRWVICFSLFILVVGRSDGLSIERNLGQETEGFHSTPSLADLKFLAQLRKELGFGDVYGDTLMMLVGPFSNFEDFTIGGEKIHINPDFRSQAYLIFRGGNYYALFDHSFYDKLSDKERIYVIAHEAWHAKRHKEPDFQMQSMVLPEGIPTPELRVEIEADFFSARSVDNNTIINFLSKYCRNMNELGWRVWSISQKQ